MIKLLNNTPNTFFTRLQFLSVLEQTFLEWQPWSRDRKYFSTFGQLNNFCKCFDLLNKIVSTSVVDHLTFDLSTPSPFFHLLSRLFFTSVFSFDLKDSFAGCKRTNLITHLVHYHKGHLDFWIWILDVWIYYYVKCAWSNK